MAEEAQKSYESRIPAIRSAAYDDGYAAGIEDGRSSDASIQRRLANLETLRNWNSTGATLCL